MVEENVPRIQINVPEESKGSLTSGSNEATQVNEERATEEVTSVFSDSSKDAKRYEEAIIYIAKTNIKKKEEVSYKTYMKITQKHLEYQPPTDISI